MSLLNAIYQKDTKNTKTRDRTCKKKSKENIEIKMKRKKNIGSSFEDFLKDESIQEEVNVAA